MKRRLCIVQASGFQLRSPDEGNIHSFVPCDDVEFGKQYVALLNRHTDLPFYLCEVDVELIRPTMKLHTDESIRAEGLEPLKDEDE